MLAMGGSQIWSSELDLGKLIPATTLMDYKLSFHFWARDIKHFQKHVHQCLEGGGGVPAMVSENSATVIDASGMGFTSAESWSPWPISRWARVLLFEVGCGIQRELKAQATAADRAQRRSQSADR
jgi:hypothetical protein